MAGRELYAPRRPGHRRTWSAAAVVLAVVFIVLGSVIALLPGLILGLIDAAGEQTGWRGLVYVLTVPFGATALLVFAWVAFAERRGLATIGFNERGLLRFVRGYGLGLAFLALVVVVIGAVGGYEVEGGGAFATGAVGSALVPIAVLLLAFIVQGSTEEIVMRGWLMQIIASRHGLVIGLVVSSALFSLLHGGNIDLSPALAVGLLNIVLVGVFLGLYAAREGSLWGVCGWHAAWNWLLGLGFGLEVSGQVIEVEPLFVDLTARDNLPFWVTGGAFGPEASVVTSAVLIAGCGWILWRGNYASRGVEEDVRPASETA